MLITSLESFSFLDSISHRNTQDHDIPTVHTLSRFRKKAKNMIVHPQYDPSHVLQTASPQANANGGISSMPSQKPIHSTLQKMFDPGKYFPI